VLVDSGKNTEEYLETRVFELLNLSEAELATLAEAGKEKQAEEEAAQIAGLQKKHNI